MKKSEKFWDSAANKFDKRAESLDDTTIKIIHKARKHLRESDSVLDYGCATGTITFEMAASVEAILGIDFSSRMIDIARSKAEQAKNEQIAFARATIFDQGLIANSFDAILAFDIFHLIEDVPQVMLRLNEILKPGGLLISTTPCLSETHSVRSYFLFILIYALSKSGLLPSMRFYRIRELEHFITGGNFQIIESERWRQSPEAYFIVAKKLLKRKEVNIHAQHKEI